MRHDLVRMVGIVFVLAAMSAVSVPGAEGAIFVVDSTVDAIDNAPGDGLCDGDGLCTLRAAVMEANAAPGLDTILLPGGNYVLRLGGSGEDASAEGDLDIWNDLDIEGAEDGAAVIDGGGFDRVFHILGEDVVVTMKVVTLRNGNADVGGAIFVEQALSPVPSSGVTFDGVTIEENVATVGGGGIALEGGDVTLTGSTVCGNTAPGGGGIWAAFGRMTILESTLRDNFAEW